MSTQASASERSSAALPARAGSAEQVLRRLEWTVLRRLDGLLQGDYRTLFRGVGLDLADLREYQHHDDVRYIDWNVTARLQAPYVREYTESREIAAWMLLDLSASIDFGSGRTSKHAVSRDFVAVLARLLTRHGNRVGALFYGNGVVACYDLEGNLAGPTLRLASKNSPRKLTLSSDGKYATIAFHMGESVEVFDLGIEGESAPIVIAEWKFPYSLSDTAISPEGMKLVAKQHHEPVVIDLSRVIPEQP